MPQTDSQRFLVTDAEPDRLKRQLELERRARVKAEAVAEQAIRELNVSESLARELRRKQDYYRSLTEQSRDLTTILNADGSIRYESKSIRQILGYEPEEMVGKNSFEFVHPEDLPQVVASFKELMETGGMKPVEFRFRHKNGSWCPLEAVGTNFLKNPIVGGVVVNSRDSSDRRRAEEALRESEERYALAARAASDGLWDWNLQTSEIYFSPRWQAMLGYEEGVIGNQPEEWFSRLHAHDQEQLRSAISTHLEGLTPHLENQHRLLHRDGSYRWVLCRGMAVRGKDGKPHRIAGSASDITDRKNAEEQLLHDAFHDALTDLPNRALFIDRLEHALQKRQHDYIFAVLFLDLDRFKIVNDGLGHAAGDQLLVAIAERLSRCLRPGDTVARLGGDEFTILLESMKDISDATRTAERIQEELTRPFLLGEAGKEQEVFSSASIGIALSVTGYNRAEEVVRDADTAMYRAKSLGKSRYEVFDKAMHARALTQLQLETDLRRGIERQEFLLHYQPIIGLQDRKIAGFEALIRWKHPERGFVPPADFIPIAEETGQILPIGTWVLREACRQTFAWQKQFPEQTLIVSVNLSAKQFGQPDLIEQIRAILNETGLAGNRLKLEITESVVMENAERAIAMLRQLRELGLQISIDDFGTGYSSFSYLRRFPLDTLKIDRCFITRMNAEVEDREIVRSIVSLAHNLGMKVVAEGAENPEQVYQLLGLGCEYAQGYFFSRPVAPDEFEKLLADPNASSIMAGLRS